MADEGRIERAWRKVKARRAWGRLVRNLRACKGPLALLLDRARSHIQELVRFLFFRWRNIRTLQEIVAARLQRR